MRYQRVHYINMNIKDKVSQRLMNGLLRSIPNGRPRVIQPVYRPILLAMPNGWDWIADTEGLTKPSAIPDMSGNFDWLDNEDLAYIGPFWVDVNTIRAEPSVGIHLGMPIDGDPLTRYIF